MSDFDQHHHPFLAITEERNKKTPPEQSKLFEFALMYEGEADDDKENLSISHDNILLREFVNLVNTDEEADI